MEEKSYQTPLEDLRKSALEDYEIAADSVHHWNSFIVNAIKNYDPNNKQIKSEIIQKIEELIKLQTETALSSWIINFSEHDNKFNFYLTNCGKKLQIINLYRL